jgi:hypothetical protein
VKTAQRVWVQIFSSRASEIDFRLEKLDALRTLRGVPVSLVLNPLGLQPEGFHQFSSRPRLQGLFTQEDGPNSQVSGLTGHRTCDVACSRMKGLTSVGEWLSLVEHLVRDQGVGGSNPLSPTNLKT